MLFLRDCLPQNSPAEVDQEDSQGEGVEEEETMSKFIHSSLGASDSPEDHDEDVNETSEDSSDTEDDDNQATDLNPTPTVARELRRISVQVYQEATHITWREVLLWVNGNFEGALAYWRKQQLQIKVLVISWLFLTFWYLLMDNRWTDLDRFVAPSIFLLIFYVCRVGTTALRGETWLFVKVSVLCALAVGLNIVADHPCSFCALEMPEFLHRALMPSAEDTSGLQNSPTNQGLLVWRTLMTEESPVTQHCAECLSKFTGTYELLFASTGLLKSKIVSDKLEEYGLDTLGLFREDDRDEESYAFETSVNSEGLISFEDVVSPTVLRELDEWYNNVKQNSYPKGAAKRFIQALATGVRSEIGTQLLAHTTQDALCYPYSRIKGPSPSDFVLSLRHSRFTGETDALEGPMNITMGKLQAIMRGDVMRRLGPHVCFMVRLASVIPEDTTVLTSLISPGDIEPIGNETVFKGVDASFLYPALYVPSTDEDKDKNGSSGQMMEALISLYINLPHNDWDPVYFETEEEYVAFFRWHIEESLQDEYYLPKWLANVPTKDLPAAQAREVQRLVMDTGNLVSRQFRERSERLRLTYATTDETLSDRAFYGSGMKKMTQIKLPGDLDYEFHNRAGPEFYETDEHVEFFRNQFRPKSEDLLRMGRVFWGKEVPLEKFRKRVVEIDYTASNRWEHRELFEDQGAILYLDAKSKKPMGIWVTCIGQIVLPTAGPQWEYAKFHYRATELTVMALIHVAEYHLGWSNIFSNAMRQTLPPDHGLRMFLKPYTHGTPAVNWNAYQMLIRDRSILDRASGLTRLARGHTWGHIQKHHEINKPWTQILDEKRLDGMADLKKTIPFFKHGVRLYKVHEEFVDGMLELMYPDDTSLQNDKDLQRFWHHVNTYGRNMDPCVCAMPASLFFEPGVWPDFETRENRRCEYLMEFAGVLDEDTPRVRREKWCSRSDVERTRTLHRLLESECEASHECPSLSYDFLHMRPDFGLGPEPTREALKNLLSTFIMEVTACHELVADNIPYMVDPEYGGVRLQRRDTHGKYPLKVDIATYIFGTVIAALTTIRSKPLLSDWSNLLEEWADNVPMSLRDSDRKRLRQDAFMLHLRYKAALVSLSNSFIEETAKLSQNKWSPFLVPASQAASVAV